LIIVICVDDIIISICSLTTIQCFKTHFTDYFNITDLGELRYVLRILVEYDCTNCLIYLSQESYLKQVLKYFGIANTYLVFIFFTVGTMLSILQSLQTLEDLCKFWEYSNRIHYLSLVGSLLYAIQNWPNIQFGSNSSISHFQLAKHILYYLKGTLNLKLVLD